MVKGGGRAESRCRVYSVSLHVCCVFLYTCMSLQNMCDLWRPEHVWFLKLKLLAVVNHLCCVLGAKPGPWAGAVKSLNPESSLQFLFLLYLLLVSM